ncbi:hypothetical protein ACHAW6_004316 [Cyclotella cf. meneghiniana]
MNNNNKQNRDAFHISVARRNPNARSFNFTNGLIFLGLSCLFNVYVTLVVQESYRSSEMTKASVSTLMDSPMYFKHHDWPDRSDSDDDIDESSYQLSDLDSPKVQEASMHFSNQTGASSTTPSLAIVSACILGQRFSEDYIQISLTNKRHYCQRYNVMCILPTERVNINSTLHTKWDKLYHVNHTLYTEQVDWVLWMDCDAAFTNFEIDWYTHLKSHLNSSQLMVVSKDKNGINTGVFFVPNTHLARIFIEKLYKLRHLLDRRFFHKDQAALKYLLEKNPPLSSRLEVVSQKLMNTYMDNNAGIKWTPYDFIVHQVFCWELAGCIANFTSLLKTVTPQYYPTETTAEEAKQHDDNFRENRGTGFFHFISNLWRGSKK